MTDVVTLLESLDADARARLVADLEPLSPNQMRLWSEQQSSPRSNAYTVNHGFRLTGTLSAPALADAVRRVVNQHDVLRSVVVDLDGTPRALPLDVDAVGCDVIRCTDVDDPATVTAIDKALTAPFDLRREPPVRARIFTDGTREHVLAVAFHHMATDGWSMANFDSEVRATYDALTTGRHPDLAPAPQYSRFARWQAAQLTNSQEAERYWRTALPSDPPRRRVLGSTPFTDGHGKSVRTLIAVPEDGAAIRSASARLGATPFAVFQTAVQWVLGRFADEDQLVLGTTTLNRELPEFEKTQGFFVNTVPLHTRLSADLTFAEAVDRGMRTVLGALAHDSLPYDRIVHATVPELARLDVGLVQAIVEYQPDPVDRWREWAGLEVTPWVAGATSDSTAKFDLTFFLLHGAGGMRLVAEHDAAVLDEPLVQSIASAVFHVIEVGAARPDASLAEIGLVPAVTATPDVLTARGCLGRPTNSRGLAPVDQQIRALRTFGDRVAVVDGRTSFTFEQLVDRAEAVAGELVRRSSQPGEHNGTFRGFAFAFVAAESALRQYWVDSALATSTQSRGESVRLRLEDAIDPTAGVVRGRGLAIGIETASGAVGAGTVARCFEDGLLVETCGVDGRVIKLLPPLTASDDELQRGVDTVVHALARHTHLERLRDDDRPRSEPGELALTRRHW